MDEEINPFFILLLLVGGFFRTHLEFGAGCSAHGQGTFSATDHIGLDCDPLLLFLLQLHLTFVCSSNGSVCLSHHLKLLRLILAGKHVQLLHS